MKTVLNDKRFFKCEQYGKISGVCAGIAKYFHISSWIVRALTVSVFLFFPFAIGLAYVMATLLLKYK